MFVGSASVVSAQLYSVNYCTQQAQKTVKIRGFWVPFEEAQLVSGLGMDMPC